MHRSTKLLGAISVGATVALIVWLLILAAAAEAHVVKIGKSIESASAQVSCPITYTVQDYRSYASRVYQRKRVSKKAHRVLDAMHRCQHSYRARVAVGSHHDRYKTGRESRQRIARMGVKGIAYQMLAARGATGQFPCLVALWHRESGWSVRAHNRSSGAHGIPQALPGSKMGPGWQSNPHVQIRWGINYTYSRYGGPCAANSAQLRQGWY